MDLLQLKMLCAVAECGSVVKAAQQLHRVPSNLTTRIKQLENELGYPLFIREKQRLRLSPIGDNFLEYARKILKLSEEAMRLGQPGVPAGTLKLGTMESIAATKLPPLLAAYHQRYPTVALSLVTGTSGEVLEGVLSGELAAALSDTPGYHDELETGRVFDDQLVLITSQNHQTVTSPLDVQGETFFALLYLQYKEKCIYQRNAE